MEARVIKISRRKKPTESLATGPSEEPVGADTNSAAVNTNGIATSDTQFSALHSSGRRPSSMDNSGLNRLATSFDSSVIQAGTNAGTNNNDSQHMARITEAKENAKRSVDELLTLFFIQPKKISKSRPGRSNDLSPSQAIENQPQSSHQQSINNSTSSVQKPMQQSSNNNFNKFLNAKVNYVSLTDVPEPEPELQSVSNPKTETTMKTIESTTPNNLSSTSMSTRKRINLNHSKTTNTKSTAKSTAKSTVLKSGIKKPTKTKTGSKTGKNLDSLLAASALGTPENVKCKKRPRSPLVANSNDNDEVDIVKFEFKGSTPVLRKSIRNFQLDRSINKSTETPKSKLTPPEENVSSTSKENLKPSIPIVAKEEAAVKDTALKDETLKEMIVCKKAYQIVEKLGCGGSCSVYNIRDKVTKKHFALKIVDLSKHDQAIIAGFKEEINTLKSLKDCKRVVHFFDHEFRSTRLLIVMEKGDLTFETQVKEARNADGKLEPLDIRYFWKEMLRCVEEIHSRGIVHSDLKPANFIIVRGRMKLIDFGISKQIETDHTSIFNPNIIGSVDFMAPETVTKTELAGKRGVKYNQKADIWSLGIILYYLAYNKTPFEDFHKAIKFMSIKDAAIIYPPCDNTEVVELLKFVLQKEPLKRPTVQALLKHSFCR